MSVVVIDIIKPKNNGLFPTHEDVDALGGFQVQSSTTNRDAIPTANRKAGMLVYVTSNATFYQLASNLTTWNVLSLGGTVTLAGDVTGPAGGNLVVNIQGNPVSSTAPGTGQVLGWNGSQWAPTNNLVPDIHATTISYAAPTTSQIVLVGTLGGPINITLPASPTSGQVITVKDANGSAFAHNITVLHNGHNIDGTAGDIVMNTNFQSVQLVFSSFGWNIL